MLLALLFVCISTAVLYLSVVGLLADVGDPLHEAGCLFFLVMSFMAAALGLGLWNLDDDARRAAIAVFGFPALILILTSPLAIWHDRPSVWEVVEGLSLFLFYGSPALYLRRPRVQEAFDQFLTVRLNVSPPINSKGDAGG
jgi:hypothetical protein